jgi:hypothetical protein
VVDVQSIQKLISEQEAFAISNVKDVGSTLNDEHAKCSGAAGLGAFRVLFVEFEVEFEEGFVHEDFDHL